MNEDLSKESGSEVKTLRAEREEAMRKIQLLQEFKDKYDQVDALISQKEEQIRDLEEKLASAEQEKNDIKIEAVNLVKKFKNDAVYKDNLVLSLLKNCLG